MLSSIHRSISETLKTFWTFLSPPGPRTLVRTTIGVGIVIMLPVVCSYYLITRRNRRIQGLQKELPPGPVPLPFIGSWHLLDFNNLHESLDVLGKTYGDVFTIYVFSRPFIILNSYSAIKQGFIDDRHLMAGRPYNGPQENPFLGDYSETWREAKKNGIVGMRRFAGPNSDIENFMHKEIDTMLQKLTQTSGEPMDVRPIFYRATGNITSSFLFGVHYDHDDPEFQHYINAVDEWFRLFHSFNPDSQFGPDWLINLKYRQELETWGNVMQVILEHCVTMVERARKTMDPAKPQCFLEYYMAETDVSSMSDMELADVIMTYIVDPVDTITTLLQWCVLYLAYFPPVQSRLYQCIQEVVRPGERVRMEHRGVLGLVESFIHEVQRHSNFTPISFPHTCTRPAARFRDYTIPRDITIIANFYAVHKDAALHPEPQIFKEDRFVDETGKFRKTDTVLTFSTGSRSCPGDIHTRMELFLFVSNLVHRFNITFPDGQEKPPLTHQGKSFFLIPHKFEVIFTPR